MRAMREIFICNMVKVLEKCLLGRGALCIGGTIWPCTKRQAPMVPFFQSEEGVNKKELQTRCGEDGGRLFRQSFQE